MGQDVGKVDSFHLANKNVKFEITSQPYSLISGNVKYNQTSIDDVPNLSAQ